MSDEPTAYQSELDFNTKKYPQYSHVIETFDDIQGGEKVCRLCRCWQSSRFPYCDNTHKAVVQSGDNVGPFVAKIRMHGNAAGKNRNVNNITNVCAQKIAAFSKFTAGVALAGCIGYFIGGVLKNPQATKKEITLGADFKHAEENVTVE